MSLRNPCLLKTPRRSSPALEIIGQERALKAIRLGLEMESLGYNIFVVGLVGNREEHDDQMSSGRDRQDRKIPDDICYVNNFKDPGSAQKRLPCPPGKGKVFKKDMEDSSNP